MKISILISLVLLLISSCVQQRKVNPELPLISVSILPQKYFIEQLAGENVEVNVMVPPGASPATYEPTVSQLSQLDQSVLYMKMGYLGFELSWMDKIRSVNPDMEVIDLSHGIQLIYSQEEHNVAGHEGHNHHHGGVDPHIWMSAGNASGIAKNMARALTSVTPGDSLQIADRLSILLNRIDSLDLEIGNILAETKGKSFMIYHPSLSYFARDYNLEQLSLEQDGKTPSPSHMKELSDLGREHGVSCIFVQVEFDRKNAEVLAAEIGAKIVPLNPLDEEWAAQMMYIAKKLKQ